MGDETLDGVELVEQPWWMHDAEVAASGLLTMLRRLPILVREVLILSWRTSRADTVVMLGATMAAELFTAFGLLATNDVLTRLFQAVPTGERIRAAMPAIVAVVASMVLRAAFREAAAWIKARLEPQITQTISTRLVELTTRVELAAFDDPDFHDQVQRTSALSVRGATWLLWAVMGSIGGLFGLVTIAGALGVLHPLLMPLVLLATVPTTWASVRSARVGYQVNAGIAAANRRQRTLQDLMTERASAAEVRSYGMRGHLLAEFERVYSWITRYELRAARRQQLTTVVGSTLGGVADGAVYVVLGVLLWAGQVELAAAATAVLAIQRAGSATSSFLYGLNSAYEAGLYFSDYRDFLTRAQERISPQGGTAAPADLDRVSVREASFTYPGAEEPALRGVSIEIEPGQVVALVGENGSGKTTLSKLVGGLYLAEEGTVSWGGVESRDIDRDALRGRIAVIAQDFTHWPFTAGQNITLSTARPPASVLAASGADRVVERLPYGLDTLLDPAYRGGTELSGGQWQRIAVARGLYRDAPLLICDEPTAALDARSEHAIFESIRRHAVQRTVLMITHRLASVRWADRIYVLERGRVVESGDHAELMERGGVYAEMYTLQAKAYAG
ncbi:ABC transporter ATP-binding protein [Nonomuraea soli]|uniref:ATP-binding cassette subfamily B protein/ATP-binding cassette subfamily C protein n=1 Tax=Nonomuraea soli TaxID=1032476 RepID=A0A7W0CT99_9ACTN|nr:ABC transporter ATP-binding protein [Nonomuraea soli]MBA2896916.1 ATP-binding cassette subfamily B protein/ATP-binding cassette subfamily C protein [Nonomuraea soli]